MKKILIAVLILGLFSCESQNVSKRETDYIIHYGSSPLKIVSIEGCEYFLGEYGRTTFMTHKGNCKNPIHYK